ncbi:sigma-70 family RNA polymerase sigma factor [Nitrospinae bacterium AH_259_B05_G02_I21]|nr:sigma-70 family RNA polymerase sigma factor [Nitrospinae bacterium AH_259_B05_G02_I21]
MDRDAFLVEQCRAGDEEACEALVRQYQERVFALISRMTGDPDRVEDIAQEVFLKTFRSLKSFRGGSRFYTWLYRITVNTVLNTMRSQGRRQETSLDALEGFEVQADADMEPAEVTARLELARRVREAIDQLEEPYRVIVYLRELEDLSYEEIAQVVELPVGTVKSRLFRARQHLKGLLQDLLPATAHQRGPST